MRHILLSLVSAMFLATSAQAADAPPASANEFNLVIKDHVFTPSELTVPADQKFTLIIENQDKTPEEFESHDFHREKIIPAGKKVKIPAGPLKAGTYSFFGEFNPKTAQGKIIVK